MSIPNAPRITTLSLLAGLAWAGGDASKVEVYVMDLLAEMVGRPRLAWRA